MIYRELGATPLYIDIQSRLISFWAKLILNTDKAKISSIVYAAIYSLREANQIKSQWMDNVKNILCTNGFSGVWYNQSFNNSTWLIKALKQKLKDILYKTGTLKCIQLLKVIFIKYIKPILSKGNIYIYIYFTYVIL